MRQTDVFQSQFMVNILNKRSLTFFKSLAGYRNRALKINILLFMLIIIKINSIDEKC